MKFVDNIPIGIFAPDDPRNPTYSPEDNHLQGDNAILPNGVTDPRQYYEESIASKTNMTADQRDAYRNTFLELLIRDEDFRRSSPQVQLERLMATGMSRAQAIQLLNSGGSGSGTGSSVVPQMAGNSEQAISERINAIGNTIQAASAAAQSIGQLFMIGSQIGLNKSTMQLQAAQALFYTQQANSLAIGNRMAQDEYNAMGAAAAAIQVLDNYSRKTGYQSPDNINDWLDHVNKTPDATLKLWQEKHKVDLSNPFYYASFKKAYENYKKGDFDLEAYRRQTLAQARVSELSVENIVQDIAKTSQETANLSEQFNLIKQSIRTTSASASRLEMQNDVDFTPDTKTGVSPYRMRSKGEGYMSYYAGLLADMNYELTYSYEYPIMAEDALIELQAWQSFSEEEIKERKKAYVENFKNQELCKYITACRLANMYDFNKNHPSMAALFDIWQAYDMPADMLQAGAKAATFGYIGKSVNVTH